MNGLLVRKPTEGSSSKWVNYIAVFETVGKQDDSEYDVEQAWMRVRNQTVEKKKKFNLKGWLPYAALVAILFSVGLYFMNRSAEQDWTVEVDVLKNINQPTYCWIMGNGFR